MRTSTIIMSVGMALMLLGCGLLGEDRKPAQNDGTVLVESQAVAPAPLAYNGPSSLEERILASPVIVRVRLDSATSTVESAIVHDGTTKYIALLEFSFSVLEYLKGASSTESVVNDIVAVWQSRPVFDTRQEAEATLPAIAAARDTKWDDHEAIVFLQRSIPYLLSTQQPERFHLSFQSEYSRFPGDDRYSIASRYDKLWLPAEAAVGAASQPGGDQQRFLMDVPSSTGTALTITLGEVNTRIASVTARVDAVDGSEEYMECVRLTYLYERRDRHYRATYPAKSGSRVTNDPPHNHNFGSGMASETVLYEDDQGFGLTAEKRVEYWLDGGDSALFNVVYGAPIPYDSTGDGVKDAINFTRHVVSVRPIPSGVYRLHFNTRGTFFSLCDGYTSRYEWTVTANAPAGATHEFFFDPVTVGSTVAADSSNGVLKPHAFTDAGGDPATVESITYEASSPGSGQAGKVKVKVVPWDALKGVLDIIELDGTVSTSLRVANSSVDQGSNTFTWSVSSQPWHDGDKLMARIRGSAPFAPAPRGLTSTAVGDDSVSLSWDSGPGVTGHLVERRVSSDAGWESVDAKVTDTTYTVSGLSCGTSYEFRVGAYGDGTRYERVTGRTASHYATVSETTGACATQESPVFVNAAYSFSVIEDAPVGSTVGVVSATDAENDTVTYSITSGNDAEKFAIDVSTGRITLAGTLDHDTASSHTLTAQADDGNGGRDTATVTVTVE